MSTANWPTLFIAIPMAAAFGTPLALPTAEPGKLAETKGKWEITMSNMDVLANLETRMNYVADRQQVLTQNIANADTPGYRAMELQAPDFSKTLASVQPVQMAATSPMHLSGTRGASAPTAGTLVVNRNPAEVSPTGNTVSVEDETRKAAENAMDYQLVTNVYKSIGGMVMKAAGKSG